MKLDYQTSPHQLGSGTVNQMMKNVIYCLCPGALMSLWFFGIGVVLNITIALVAALLFESACLRLRARPVAAGLNDYSAAVTAILFALSIPPGTPWGLVVAGAGFGIIVCKHIYGGLGQNPFNPAMGGYLFLLLSFPLNMTSWHVPLPDGLDNGSQLPLSVDGIKQSLIASFPFLMLNTQESLKLIDGMAMATPLIEYKMASPNALAEAFRDQVSIWNPNSGTGWELVNLGYMFGGLALLATGTIRWQIPTAVLVTVAGLSLIFYAPGSAAITGTPYMHLLGSATMLAAFFIATDPVSAATTNLGRFVYGVIIGVSIYVIRVWGSYLDAVAIAVVFGNFCAPLIDHVCRPRVFGKQSFWSKALGRKAP